jgi:chromosome segregation ATPase
MTDTPTPQQADPARFARNAANAAANAGAAGSAELALQIASLQESLHIASDQIAAGRQEVEELQADLDARDEQLAAKDAELARLAQVNHGLQQRVVERTSDDEVATDEAPGSAPEEAPGES